MATPGDAIERMGDRADRWRRWWRGPHPSDDLPLVLNRRRIYVLPTGFGLLVGVLLGGMLLGALNYNNNPAILMAFALAAIAHNGLLHAHLALSGLRIVAWQAEPVFVGETASLRLRIQGGTRARRRLEWLSASGQTTSDIPADTEIDIQLPVATSHRGWQVIPRLRVSSVQPFGFARAWSWLRPKHAVLVYPKPEASFAPLNETDEGGHGGRRVRSEGDEPHHLRDYQRGDPPRQIAWKASARNQQLLIRQYEAGQPKAWILDWQRTRLPEGEARIARLTRWVLEAERRQQPYRLVLPGSDLGPGLGPGHRHACLRALALLPHG